MLSYFRKAYFPVIVQRLEDKYIVYSTIKNCILQVDLPNIIKFPFRGNTFRLVEEHPVKYSFESYVEKLNIDSSLQPLLIVHIESLEDVNSDIKLYETLILTKDNTYNYDYRVCLLDELEGVSLKETKELILELESLKITNKNVIGLFYEEGNISKANIEILIDKDCFYIALDKLLEINRLYLTNIINNSSIVFLDSIDPNNKRIDICGKYKIFYPSRFEELYTLIDMLEIDMGFSHNHHIYNQDICKRYKDLPYSSSEPESKSRFPIYGASNVVYELINPEEPNAHLHLYKVVSF